MKSFSFVCSVFFLCIGAGPLTADTTPHDLKQGDVLLYTGDPTQGFVFNQEQIKNHYLSHYVTFATGDIGRIPQKDAVLFIGNRTFSQWETLKEDMAPLPVLDRGYRVMRMKEARIFADFFARYQARTIVLYGGENDLRAEYSIDHYARNVAGFVREIHRARPDTRILLLSPKPSPHYWKYFGLYQRAGEKLKAFAEETPKVDFVDMTDVFLNEKGKPDETLYESDGRTLNAAGYRALKAVLRSAPGLSDPGAP